MNIEPAPKDALTRPGAVGRLVRLILGGLLLAWVVRLLGQAEMWTGQTPPGGLIWVGVAAMVWAQESLFTIGLIRPWGHRPQMVWGAMTLVVWGVGYAIHDRAWTPPVGWWIYGTTTLMAAMLGIAFMMSAWRATPG